MTMCGCAFVVWRSRAWVPQDMVFCGEPHGASAGAGARRPPPPARVARLGLQPRDPGQWLSPPPTPLKHPHQVDYLGKEEGNLTINFSRPAAQIVGQCEPICCRACMPVLCCCGAWRRMVLLACSMQPPGPSRRTTFPCASPSPPFPTPIDYNFVRLGRDGLRRTFDDLYVIYEDLRACLQQMGAPRRGQRAARWAGWGSGRRWQLAQGAAEHLPGLTAAAAAAKLALCTTPSCCCTHYLNCLCRPLRDSVHRRHAGAGVPPPAAAGAVRGARARAGVGPAIAAPHLRSSCSLLAQPPPTCLVSPSPPPSPCFPPPCPARTHFLAHLLTVPPASHRAPAAPSMSTI